jgi:hypothetical protein
MGHAGLKRHFYFSSAVRYLISETQNMKIWNSTNNFFSASTLKPQKDKFRDIRRLRRYKLFQPCGHFLVLSNQARQMSAICQQLFKREIQNSTHIRMLVIRIANYPDQLGHLAFTYRNCTYILLRLKFFSNLSNTHKELRINVLFVCNKCVA